MRSLRLVALSDDGQSLILSADGGDSPDGERFELPIDDRLRAAARGDARRLTQIDVDLGTELPPRVIQFRIRAGETPEQVAAASGTRVERIMRFAHPVLQERARIAEQAREARVRLSEVTPNTTLERFLTDRLRLLDTDLEAVRWDAHRNDDGAWLVTGAWRAGDKSGTTRWVFDLPARTVTPYDAATTDFAEGTRLVRVVPDVPVHLTGAPVQRSRPVTMLRESGRTESPPTSEPDDEAGDHPEQFPTTDTHRTDVLDDQLVADGEESRDVHPPTGSTGRSAEALLDEVAEHDTVVLSRTEGEEDDDPRARIPAWEDIVFGVRRHR